MPDGGGLFSMALLALTAGAATRGYVRMLRPEARAQRRQKQQVRAKRKAERKARRRGRRRG